jgi:hypothetical protein
MSNLVAIFHFRPTGLNWEEIPQIANLIDNGEDSPFDYFGSLPRLGKIAFN